MIEALLAWPHLRLAVLVLLAALALACGAAPLGAEEAAICAGDAMLVFDASGSMSAADEFDTTGLKRIDRVREALAKLLPSVAPQRRLGLITYGPGPSASCENVMLKFAPVENATDRILAEIGKLTPAGRTPLTRAVVMAAEVLNFRSRPATIVLLTDGEETCGGAPCKLAEELKASGAKVTVHVITYRIRDALGSDAVFASRCLADATGGLFVETETTDELAAALKEALGCVPIADIELRGRGGVRSRSASSGP
jgi:Ca-activated chloride channel family protein